MRGVKAMGLSDAIKKHVENLRGKEIDGSKHVRWMQVAYNASGKFASTTCVSRELR